MSALFQTECMMLLLLLLGMLLGRFGRMPEQARGTLSGLVMDVFLPASILKACAGTKGIALAAMWKPLAVSAAAVVVLALVSGRLARNSPPEQRAMKRYSLLFSNCGFLGFPLCRSIYGEAGLVYAAVLQIPILIGMWTVGVWFFQNERSLRAALRKLLRTPSLLATAAGLVLLATGWTVPAALGQVLEALSGCMTPVVMLLIGAMLGPRELKGVWKRDALSFSAVRLLFLPALMLVCCMALRVEPMAAGVLTLFYAMPAPTIGVILSVTYRQDTAYANRIVLYSTLLSMGTVPLLCTACRYLIK